MWKSSRKDAKAPKKLLQVKRLDVLGLPEFLFLLFSLSAFAPLRETHFLFRVNKLLHAANR
jgi:hypothetical protein